MKRRHLIKTVSSELAPFIKQIRKECSYHHPGVQLYILQTHVRFETYPNILSATLVRTNVNALDNRKVWVNSFLFFETDKHEWFRYDLMLKFLYSVPDFVEYWENQLRKLCYKCMEIKNQEMVRNAPNLVGAFVTAQLLDPIKDLDVCVLYESVEGKE